MTRRSLWFLAPLACVLACRPELPVPADAGAAGGGGAALAFDVALEPGAPLDAAPSVLQLRIDLPPVGAAPERVVLAEGELGPGHLRELAENDISDALSERLLDVIAWADSDGAIHAAPTAALEPGELYAL